MQRLKALVLPDGLVLAAAAALVHWGAAAPGAAAVVRLYPLIVLLAGAFLSWRFRRGRIALAFAGLVFADGAMLWFTPFDADAPYAAPEIVRTIGMLLPLGFALLAFVGERGLLTRIGLRRLLVFGAHAGLVAGVWLLSAATPETTSHAFDLELVPRASMAWLPLGQPAAFVALAAIAVLVARTLWRPDAEGRGFLWAAIACVIAASAGPAGGRATLHLANAGLVLVVATVESVYAMAYADELTGLPARRGLHDALLRVEGIYTVAMVDVDHFKQFNDTHGHDVGDQVLRMVATRLAHVGGGGRAFRYGGEEFTVLFAGKTKDDAAPHLEALRAAVEDATFTVRGPGRPRRKPKSPRARAAKVRQLAVTVSVGVADSGTSVAPEHVLKAADEALYRAKENGRNRVEV